jgi:hypothetical protein
MNDIMKEEQEEMIENDNQIARKIDEEAQNLMSLVNLEKKSREETEEALLDMLKSMINAMKTQLDNERQERINTQQHLITLLEDMCNKLEKANDQI